MKDIRTPNTEFTKRSQPIESLSIRSCDVEPSEMEGYVAVTLFGEDMEQISHWLLTAEAAQKLGEALESAAEQSTW